MTCNRIIFHDLAGAASAFSVNLEENHFASLGHAKLVLIHNALHHHRIQHGFQERGERTLFRVKREGAGNVFVGDDIRRFHYDSRLLSRCPSRDTWDSGTSWDSFEFLEQAADGGFAEAQLDGDLADRFTGCFQFGYLLLALFLVFRTESPKKLALAGNILFSSPLFNPVKCFYIVQTRP